MPGIDYREVRALIPMSRVLELLGYVPTTRKGDQLRGPCPIQGNPKRKGDEFAVHLSKQVYYCHNCKSGGDQLDLWQAIHKVPLYRSTLNLCFSASIEPPWLDQAGCKAQPPRSSRNQ